MGLYGAASVKPRKAWSNDAIFLRHIHERAGQITEEEKQQIKAAPEAELVTTSYSSNGKRSWTGNHKALQSSQQLC